MKTLWHTRISFAALFLVLGTIGDALASAFMPFHHGKPVTASEYSDATSGLSASQPLRWTYYFSAKDSKRFAAAVAGLKTKLYVVVGERRDETGKYRLQLARVEVHTADSLHQRNEALFDLASGEGIAYEGWSVSPEETK